MKEFYFGCADGSSKKALESINQKLNIMINYASKYRTVPKNVDKLFIDSGGFSFFYKMKEYPDSHEKYLRFVQKRRNVDYFANRDYPCEPELLKKHKRTVKENQEKTIKNEIEILELIENDYPELRKKFVAVVQGWEIEEYLTMLDTMKEHDLITNRVAIGSVCRRNQDNTIRKIINNIRKELPTHIDLHAFGVKFNILRFKDVWDNLTSVDSQAWRYALFNNGTPVWIQAKEKIEKYLKLYKRYEKKHSKQTLLWM